MVSRFVVRHGARTATNGELGPVVASRRSVGGEHLLAAVQIRNLPRSRISQLRLPSTITSAARTECCSWSSGHAVGAGREQGQQLARATVSSAVVGESPPPRRSPTIS